MRMCVLLWELTDSAVHVLIFIMFYGRISDFTTASSANSSSRTVFLCVIRQIGTLSYVEIRDLCTVQSVVNVTDQPRISYGLDQSAPSKIRFLRFKPSSCNLYGAERIFPNCHGAEPSGYPLIEIITDFGGADYPY